MVRKSAIGVFLLLVALIGALAAPAAAQDDEQEIAAINLSLRREPNGATVIPIDISLVGRRALSGTLIVRAPNARVNWEIPIQIAANTEARQTILVPVTFNEVNIEAELVIDGEVVADAEFQNFNANGPENAVGVLGLAGEGSVPMAPNVGDASLIEITNLGLLAGLDSVVASPAGLRSLSVDEQRSLLAWTAAGHQLLVANDSGSIDELLPSEWRSESNVVQVGTGFLRYVSTSWEGNIPPGPSVSTDPGFLTGFGPPAPTAMLADAGFRVPGLGVIALLLLAYLIVAGPVTFGVLAARGKQTLTWVVLPVLAVLFTAGVFVVGGVLTSGRGNGHATIAEITPVGAAITDSLLIADDGRQTIELPVGYQLLSSGLTSFGQDELGSPVIVQPASNGDTLVFEIEPGSGGTAIVSGRTDALADALVVTDVVLTDDAVTGRIQNNSGEDLEQAIAFLGSRLSELGEIGDGETIEFSISLAGRARQQLPEARIWNFENNGFFGEFDQGFGGPQPDEEVTDGPVNGAAWVDWRARRAATAVPDGMVTVAGWTREINVSQLKGNGRTALVARAGLGNTNGPIPASALRVVPMSAFNGFDEFGNGSEMITQVIRPSDSDTSQVALDVQQSASRVDLWVAGEWRSVQLEENGRFTTKVPSGAWSDDVLWIRADSGGFFEPGFESVRLDNADEDDEIAVLMPSGESSTRNVQGFDGGFDGGFVELVMETEVVLDDNDQFVGSGEIFNSFDVWFVELQDGDEITIEMFAVNQQLDPFLVLIGPDGRQLAEDDDGAGNLNSRIVLQARESGQYVIETRPLGGGGNGGYDVEISVERADAGDAG